MRVDAVKYCKNISKKHIFQTVNFLLLFFCIKVQAKSQIELKIIFVWTGCIVLKMYRATTTRYLNFEIWGLRQRKTYFSHQGIPAVGWFDDETLIAFSQTSRKGNSFCWPSSISPIGPDVTSGLLSSGL